MTTTVRLEKILSSSRLDPHSVKFVSSLYEQSKKSELSERQMEYVEKFWITCFPEESVLKKEQEWKDSFNDEMKQKVDIMYKYYKYHYSNSRFVSSYENSKNWIPSKEMYEKTVESSWASSLIKNYLSNCVFNPGDTVKLRENVHNRTHKYYYHCPDNSIPMFSRLVLILNSEKDIEHNFQTMYECIFVDMMEDQRIFRVLEKNLKKAKV